MKCEVARLSDAELEQQLLSLGLHAPGAAEAAEAAKAPAAAGGVPANAEERCGEPRLQQASLGMNGTRGGGGMSLEAAADHSVGSSGTMSVSGAEQVAAQIAALEQKLKARLGRSFDVDQLLQHTDASSSGSSSLGTDSTTTAVAAAGGGLEALGKTASSILGLDNNSAFSSWDNGQKE